MLLTLLQSKGPESFILRGSQVLNAGKSDISWAGELDGSQEWGSFINNVIISVVVINNCSAQTHGRRACFLPFP